MNPTRPGVICSMEGIGVLIALGPAVVMLLAGILIAKILDRTIH